MKKLLLILVVALCSKLTIAQTYTLEQIDFSTIDIVNNYNNFPMGINNKGFVCGYYHNPVNNDTIGFVITSEGNTILITSAITGAGSYGIKAIGINDSNMVIVNYTDAGGISRLHKCFVNQTIVVNDWPITNNIGQNNIKAFHYNNKGDITGWYQAPSNRWMFALHQGTPPAGFNPWQAWRYEIPNPYAFYNTMAGAMDTNRMVTGFYIDGSQNIPFLYEEQYAMFYVLNGSTWCHPWGKNNNGKICGEYKNGLGYVNAFVATPTYTPGQPNSGQLNLTSLANIFHSNTIQSIARAINDSNQIVGSFLHPTTGNWIGFIYTPNSGEYSVKNYSFTNHVWTQLANNTGAPASGNVWTSNFWSGFAYSQVDPFSNTAFPLIEPHIATDPAVVAMFNPGANIYNYIKSQIIDWKSFMKEIVNSDIYYNNSQSPSLSYVYRYINKRNMFLKWISKYQQNFSGICYGFAGTSAMHYLDDTYLNTKYGIGANSNLSTYTDVSADAITAIQRVYIRQNDPSLNRYGVDKKRKVLPWAGIHRCKHIWSHLDSNNYRQIYIGWISAGQTDYGYHSVFPFKIKTPQKLPFFYNNTIEYDTMYVYDSNNPTVQNEYFLIKTDKILNRIDSVYSANYSPAPNQKFFVAFNEATVGELKSISNSALKPTRSLDTIVKLEVSRNSDFVIYDVNTQNTASQDASGYTNNIENVSAIGGKFNSTFYPNAFFRDTLAELQISTTNYKDSLMTFTFDNDLIRMSLVRRALPTEKDYATSKNRYMSYGNPDNISKTLVADFSQMDPNLPTACIITASNLVLPANDSIITLNPADYQYQIIHPGNANLSYNLNVIAIYNDTVKQFSASNINMNGLTSHIIDPYFNGAQGPQTAVIIDNGNNGGNDDTLFVVQVPLGLNENNLNVDYISLYPNPTKSRFNIQIANQKKEIYNMMMTDMYGKILLSEKINHQAGNKIYDFDINQFSTGVYMVMVFDKNQNVLFAQKMIKE